MFNKYISAGFTFSDMSVRVAEGEIGRAGFRRCKTGGRQRGDSVFLVWSYNILKTIIHLNYTFLTQFHYCPEKPEGPLSVRSQPL
jgi:hypothetical protein